MSKYELLPQQLVYEGTISKEDIYEPKDATDDQVLAVHDQEYFEKLKNLSLTKAEIRRTGFPLSEQLVHREVNIAGGTIMGAQFALKDGVSFNIAGGTHHAYTNRGEGFCLLNDQAIASRYLLDQGLAKRILIVDLDVHQGNGTAEIFQHTKEVFTFSMHGEKNYPLKKEMSDLDIGLPDSTSDEFYLSTLKVNLENVLNEFQPDFAFYQSGVDILATDKLGRLSVSMAGVRERDEITLSMFHDKSIPVMCCMGGGYAVDIKDIIEAHANTYRVAVDIYA